MTPHEEPRPSLRHNRHPRQRGRRQCSDGPRRGNEPRLGNGSPRGDEPRRPGQCADATADRTSTPFQASEHRLAFSAAARRQCDNQKSTTSPFLNAGLAAARGPRGAFEVTSMIRRMSRISAMLVGRIARQEDSPSGLWRTLGKRVGCKPSGVRIPHPPPIQFHGQ